MTRKRKSQPTGAVGALSSANNNSVKQFATTKPTNGQITERNTVDNIINGTDSSNWSYAKIFKEIWIHIRSTDPELIFPKYTPWLVFVIVLISRVLYVTNKRNWWILHPDEVFQSVEVAFSEVYGYGFRAYEFLPPPGNDVTNPAMKQEGELGMHSLRSFLFPRIFMVVMVIGDWFHVRPFLMSKAFHAVICSSLPIASYFFARTVFSCHDIASLASILIGFSVHLTVFGTHTLVNSFLSPFVLLSLVPVFKGLLNRKSDPEAEKPLQNKHNGVNGAVVCSGNLNRISNGGSSSHLEKEDRSFGPSENNPMSRAFRKSFVLFLCGSVLGISSYIRIDLILFLCVLIAPHFVKVKSKQIILLLDLPVVFPVILGFSSGMLLGGADDLCSYGVWFISPYQWLKFNVGFDFATILFGRQDLDHYLKGLVLHNWSLVCLFGFFIGFSVFATLSQKYRKQYGESMNTIIKLFISSVLLLIIYSLKGHKEMRFMHNFLVLLLILYSSAVILFIKYLISRDVKNTYTRGCLFLCIGVYCFNQWRIMPSSHDKSNIPWVYDSGWDSNNVNDCFDFISQQPDVTGVFIDRSIHKSAAFSVLRKDVPLLALIHYEIYEFGSKAYLPLKPVSSLSRGRKVRVRTLSSISNYISIYNSHEYLLKLLLSTKHYNYLVMKTEKNFLKLGYELVFTSETMKVLRRTNEAKAEEYLLKFAQKLPIGSNSTVLEYEGSWLLTYGLFELAEERLVAALQLSKPTPRLFQMLVKTFLEQNKLAQARKAEQLCIDLHGIETCRTAQPSVVLHKDYNIQLPITR